MRLSGARAARASWFLTLPKNKSSVMDVIVYTDGGARGNPGPAAAAFILTDHKRNTLLAKAFFLGKATNNVAEYTALLKSLEAAGEMNAQKVLIRSDSELIVRQIKGEYRVKSP